ncbi:hypothetical protein [Streptomyces sp. Isolate_45]|uniref:hypothetical protein n=1 Tax=Streptomyces sp. Isolate_45 TaxID=2950111 RepID=UPI002481A5ED|nr:hypothetical protein [Streptomyces sp. Isolate_45]MDA5285398.1 hypothetical protein [Streptomyces sp. Isolate_45]
MTSATQPEDTTAPTDPRSDGSGGGGSGPAAGGPKATVPAQHRGPGGAGDGDGDRTGASDASDGGGEDGGGGESGADTEPGTGTDPGHPAAAPSGGDPRHDGSSTVAAPPDSGPALGRNGRVIARTAGAVGPATAAVADVDADTDAHADAGGGADADAHADADAGADRATGKRRSRRARVALAAGCGIALVAVATPFALDAANGNAKPAAGGSLPGDLRAAPAGREAGAVLRAMALTAVAIGYAPGVTVGRDPAERSAPAKARRDGRRYALAAWAATGRPAGDDALYGALLRSGGAYDDAATTHVGLAPRGAVPAADVAPEGHKLAVLTRQEGSERARMQVLAFGGDATAPTWSTVGPAVDPSSAFAISDCGGMLAFAEPNGHREVWNMMGAEPVKVFESNGGGVNRSAGERQFLDFNDDTHRLLYAHGPRDALRGEVVAVHQPVPVVEGDVDIPRGQEVRDVRLDGPGPTVVALPVGAGAEILNRYGDRVPVGPASGTRTDASSRYVVERGGPADDAHAVRVTVPRLGRTYLAVLPAGSRVADVGEGGRTVVVPVREDGKTLRMIVITDDALTVVDATRVDGTSGRGLPDGDELVAEACRTAPEPLTARELSALPADRRGAAAAAWPCD